jgi:pilus assembly protein CpaF
VFSIVITERGGAQRQLEFDSAEVSIGRLEDNEICLPKNNVSKRHSRLVLKDDRYILVDLKSTNGTYVNGRKIASPMVVRTGDKIYIGDFILTLVRPSRPAPRMPDRPAMQTISGAPGSLAEPGLGAPAGLVSSRSSAPPPPISSHPPLAETRRGVGSMPPPAAVFASPQPASKALP